MIIFNLSWRKDWFIAVLMDVRALREFKNLAMMD